MTKKQASLLAPLNIFCLILVLGLGISLLLTLSSEQDDPIKEEVILKNIIKQQKPKDAPEQIVTKPFSDENIMSSLEDNEDLAVFFDNGLSIFTELEEDDANTGIIVSKSQEIPEKHSEITKDDVAVKSVPLKTNSEIGGRIIIIIDDMGINRYWSDKIAELQAPLTLAYLPYADDLQSQADSAKKNNHHLMMHMPMEALGGNMEATPGLLQSNYTQNEFLKVLRENMNKFEGFSGINNHMGSKLTRDRTKMNLIMQELKDKNLYFIDSKTIHDSVAAKAAEQAGVPYLVRDVFLDHEENIEYVRNALQTLEKKVEKHEYAVAIGHPKEVTYMALKEWLPTLKNKNITLVNADQIIAEKYPMAEIHPYEIDRDGRNPITPLAVHIIDPKDVGSP